MIRRLFPILICIVWLSSSVAYAQIDHFVEAVRDRVTDAATAANAVLEADRHRGAAERMAAAGQYDLARHELQIAADIVRGVHVEDDLLLHEYTSNLNQTLVATEGRTRTEASVFQHAGRASFIEDVLTANSLPTSLTAIITVESGGDAMALSPKSARGLWQLMPDTARRYGLKVNDVVDERIDPIKSTYAAARYLRDLYDMFHDWPLALAGYNAGENRIQSVMERTGLRRFTEMADRRVLPSETIQYVPAVLKMMR